MICLSCVLLKATSIYLLMQVCGVVRELKKTDCNDAKVAPFFSRILRFSSKVNPIQKSDHRRNDALDDFDFINQTIYQKLLTISETNT